MSAESFWNLLRQSGLIADEQLRALMTDLSEQQSSRSLADELVKREVLTSWQADCLKQGKHRGFHLGPHRILQPLGQGGMSKVWLAEHELMRRRCAIKILPSRYQNDPDLLARFHLEAQAIAKLDHPHIVRAYDFNKDMRYGKEIHYLVMEYIDGPDLRQMIDENGPLDYRKAADFIHQAADGLAHAHAAGFVHRDIKPANLLVDRNTGVLKILDLGLARFIFEGEKAWQAPEGEQSAVGTADYVAPEQVMDSRNADGRADIYSLGLTFYFLLTGRRPFSKSTLVELLMAQKMERPEPIGNVRPDVPTELVDIIDRMTAKQPFMRFQSAKDVAETLQTWLKEAESGREYSRISALMAAAMRGKQSSGESSVAPSQPAADDNADLELVFLEEERKPPASPTDSKAGSTGSKIGSASRSASVKLPMPTSKPAERKSGVGDSGVRSAVKLPDLLGDDVITASSDPRMLDLGDQETQPFAVHPQFRRVEQPDLMKSPWLWLGLGSGFLVLLILLGIALMSSRGTSKKPSPEPTQHAATQPTQPEKEPKATPSGLSAREQAKLLADATSIEFIIYAEGRKSNDPLVMLVKQQVFKTIDVLHLKQQAGGRNQMNIHVELIRRGDQVDATMKAELNCLGPKDKTITVWKNNQRMLVPTSLAKDDFLNEFQAKMRELFNNFIEQVRKARDEVKS